MPATPILTMALAPNFRLASVSGSIVPTPWPHNNPLGPLAQLVGPNGQTATWKGKGFNQIWRPFHGTQDRFLELNETTETLEFDFVSNEIANRALLQADINLAGIRYLQLVTDAILNVGIHAEPGLWLNIPATSNPADGGTVARLANIPHGVSLVAQGSSTIPVINHAPPIGPASITPFCDRLAEQSDPLPGS